MDTNKKYIEMCEKAKEIQALWKYKDGDCESLSGAWLPRQDQLQEVVGSCSGNDFRNFDELYEFANEFLCHFDSMEQLWLAFAMKEKYNKIWNGKKWVK